MHLILTGATGLVGTAALAAMLANQSVTKISIISRRPVPMADAARDPRVNVILHQNFTKFDDPELLAKLRGAKGCVWALGISQMKVSADEYVKITKDYTLAAAEAFAKIPSPDVAAGEEKTPFDFVWVSGEGATHTPGRFTSLFGRVKGETELELGRKYAKDAHFRTTVIRPGVVDWHGDAAVSPYHGSKNRIMKGVEGFASGTMKLVWNSMSAPTEPLGRALVQMASGAWEGRYEGVEGASLLEGGALRILDNRAWKTILKDS